MKGRGAKSPSGRKRIAAVSTLIVAAVLLLAINSYGIMKYRLQNRIFAIEDAAFRHTSGGV